MGGRDVTLKTCLLRILLFLTKSITWCLQSNVFIINYFYLRKFLVFSQVFRKYYLFLCNYNWNIFNYITECCKKKKLFSLCTIHVNQPSHGFVIDPTGIHKLLILYSMYISLQIVMA